MLFAILYTAVFISAVLASSGLQYRQTCSENYELCSPTGVLSLTLPPVGPQLSNLYPDLVQAINSQGKAQLSSSGNQSRGEFEQMSPFCCARTTQCLLLPSYYIPFCWDRFTTDFYFPDGSYGSIVIGNFTSASGAQVDLIYGDWRSSDGESGNIYSEVSTARPDTSTMPMPTPWTSSGVGTAIPASELGSSAMMTSTITRTTITAITLPSTTISIGLTGLPPATTTVWMNGTGFPVTTATSSSTAASSSNRTSSFIIPPFTGGFAGKNGMGFAFCIIILNTILSACIA